MILNEDTNRVGGVFIASPKWSKTIGWLIFNREIFQKGHNVF
jgi:hypothetical protein